MSIVDERGRLFGKINLIDIGVLLFIVLVLPLAYGAYVLFRTPPPRLTAVVPATLPFSRGVDQRVQIKGQNLRPFLRAKIGTIDARSFAAQSAQGGEVVIGGVPAGTYDVILYDESQEVARLVNGLTILPAPIQVVGTLVGAAALGDRLAPGVTFTQGDRPAAELVNVGATGDPDRPHATMRVTCHVSTEHRCVVAGTPLLWGAELTLTVTGSGDRVKFLVEELRADATWLLVKTRLMGLPEALAGAHEGDVDGVGPPPTPLNSFVTTGAKVVSLGELQKNQGSFSITAVRPQPGADLSAFGVLSAAMPVDARPADLLIPAEPDGQELAYRGVAMRPGNVVVFESPKYRVQALIVSISQP